MDAMVGFWIAMVVMALVAIIEQVVRRHRANGADERNDIDDYRNARRHRNEINPATGLPMVGITDVEGNLYGDSSDLWDDHQDSSMRFDD